MNIVQLYIEKWHICGYICWFISFNSQNLLLRIKYKRKKIRYTNVDCIFARHLGQNKCEIFFTLFLTFPLHLHDVSVCVLIYARVCIVLLYSLFHVIGAQDIAIRWCSIVSHSFHSNKIARLCHLQFTLHLYANWKLHSEKQFYCILQKKHLCN